MHAFEMLYFILRFVDLDLFEIHSGLTGVSERHNFKIVLVQVTTAFIPGQRRTTRLVCYDTNNLSSSSNTIKIRRRFQTLSKLSLNTITIRRHV